MPSLVDCFPGEVRQETVEVLGHQVDIRPIKAGGFAQLGARFPKFLNSGGGIDLRHMTDELMAAIIAAGTGGLGDRKAEAVAASLPVEAQARLFEAIIRITVPAQDPLPAAPEQESAASATAPESRSSRRSTSSSVRATTSGNSGTSARAS